MPKRLTCISKVECQKKKNDINFVWLPWVTKKSRKSKIDGNDLECRKTIIGTGLKWSEVPVTYQKKKTVKIQNGQFKKAIEFKNDH